MKFLLDAHFPLTLKSWLKSRGHDVMHTRDLPRKNLSDLEDLLQEYSVVEMNYTDILMHF